MAGTVEAIFSDDTAAKLLVAGVSAVLGFFAAYALESIKARRQPRKRISFDVTAGAGMATVPSTLSEKVGVTFGGLPVKGELFEVKVLIKNSGNTVVKNQFMRFSFPSGSTVLDTYLVSDIPPEFGVTDAPLPNQEACEHRWLIGHLEKGQSLELGMLVVAQDAVRPEVFGYNEEGDVEVISEAATRKQDDAEHIEYLLVYGALSLFLPAIVSAVDPFGGIATAITRLVLFLMLMPHLLSVGRLVTRRILSKPDEGGAVRIHNDAGNVYLATGSSSIRAHVESRDQAKD